MIIDLVGFAGVGKLTIGRALTERLGGRLLDVHSVFNIAFALTEPRSEAFREAVRSVRDVAYGIAAAIPPSVPIVLTTTPGRDRAFGEEGIAAIADLARKRGSEVLVVNLLCDIEENRRRIITPGRLGSRKPIDPIMLDDNPHRLVLLDHANHLLTLDVTHEAPEGAVDKIIHWMGSIHSDRN